MIHKTRRFNAAFTKVFKQSLSGTESIQFLILSPTSLLISFSYLRLGLPKGFFSCRFICWNFEKKKLLLCPGYLNLLDSIILTMLGERNKLQSSSLWSLLHALPSLIPFELKYSPQNLVLKYTYPVSSLFHSHIAQLAILLFYIF